MTRQEFGVIYAYIAAGIGKALTDPQIEVYFDCLRDLSYEAVAVAGKRVLMSHRWANFPSIAELREAATATARGTIAELSPAEAWGMAWAAIAKIDPDVAGSFDRHTKNLPALVVRSMINFGVRDLCCGREPVAVIRGQFMKTYEQLARGEHHAALLPAAVKNAIAGIGRELPTKAAPILESIGKGGS
jgi:hypothetical protein